MFEVYADGRYLCHFDSEAEAKAFCEANGWVWGLDPEDPFSFPEELSYREVERIDEIAHKSEFILPPVTTADGEVLTPTQYYVISSLDAFPMGTQKYYSVECRDEAGNLRYLPASEYNLLAGE